MAPTFADSNRATRLRRMKILAGGLLALMVVLFVATSLAQDRWPALAYVRAFAEAAMVGAVADWFAVVALFRRPFGLPIPHTAIIPRNKDRIGRALGEFVANHFLAPEVVAAKLDSLDAAGWLARWLNQGDNSTRLARRLAGLAPALLESLDADTAGPLARAGLRQGLAAVPAAPLLARLVAALATSGHHQSLFDQLLDGAAGFLDGHGETIRERMAERSWKWLPRWVDRKLADKMVDGSRAALAEMHAPDHPWRQEAQALVLEWCDRLTRDPDLVARGESLKAEMLNHPEMAAALDAAWIAARDRLRDALASDNAPLAAPIEQLLRKAGARLAGDEHLRAVLNRWLRRAVDRVAVPRRADIGDFIAGVVERWDGRTLTRRLELQVGPDLQYIRINGTVVGGLVGLAIHGISRLLG